MKKHFALLGLALALVLAAVALAADLTPTPGSTPTTAAPVLGTPALVTPTPEATRVPKPQVLVSKDKVSDSAKYYQVHPPRKGPDGTPLALTLDTDNFPLDFAKIGLSDPANLDQIPSFLKTETQGGTYYWHDLPNGNYCHAREGGRDWFGWATGSTFHWVLWREGRFWWHHEYAERWVHWDQGYWRWQGEWKGKPLFQVVLQDGHYHACDSDGILGEDLMQTGKKEVMTEPVERPQPTRGPDDLGPAPKTGHGLSDL